MIIRVGDDGYLDLNELIEVEKKVKLFDDISTTEGDFSYSFAIPKTQNNVSIIQVYSVNDKQRKWARRINATLLNDSGIIIHVGFLRIETDNDREYKASFFSGNTNWIDELNFSLLDLNWEDMPVPGAGEDNDSGIALPVADKGSLTKRNAPVMMYEDFTPFIYVKDIIKKVSNLTGIKVSGDLLKIPEYNKLICTSGTNKFAQTQLANIEAYVGKSTNQTIAGSAGAATYALVTFTNVSSPFFNSVNANWNTTNSRYFFDATIKKITIEIDWPLDNGSSGFGFRIYKNGFSSTDVVYQSVHAPNTRKLKLTLTEVDLGYDLPESGDYYNFGMSCISNRTILAGASVRITPNKFSRYFATEAIPDLTATKVISNVFRCFNIIASYNGLNKTIYANNLDRILNSDPLDLSEYLTVDENDYEEFVSNYAKKNRLIWSPASNDFIDDFDSENEEPYASGLITIDNDFLEEEDNLIEMDFKNVWQQKVNAFGLDLPYLDLIEETVVDVRDLTSVSDSGASDEAVFNYSGNPFIGIIRVSECTRPEYNGDYPQFNYAASSTNGRVLYTGNATGKVELISLSTKPSDPIFLLNNPAQNIPTVAGLDEIFVNSNFIGWDSLPITNFLETSNYNFSLGFNRLKDRYYSATEKLLNNGIKTYAYGNIPEGIYNQIDFTRTIRINESVYYINAITGYKGSKYSVKFELIKK